MGLPWGRPGDSPPPGPGALFDHVFCEGTVQVFGGRCVHVRKTAVEARDLFADGIFDLVFVDTGVETSVNCTGGAPHSASALRKIGSNRGGPGPPQGGPPRGPKICGNRRKIVPQGPRGPGGYFWDISEKY